MFGTVQEQNHEPLVVLNTWCYLNKCTERQDILTEPHGSGMFFSPCLLDGDEETRTPKMAHTEV